MFVWYRVSFMLLSLMAFVSAVLRRVLVRGVVYEHLVFLLQIQQHVQLFEAGRLLGQFFLPRKRSLHLHTSVHKLLFCAF